MSVQTKIVLTLGELLWDRFPEGRRPGGAPANVAFHATQLGLRGEICSRVGDDPDGLALLEELAARGVSTRLVQRDSRLETGTVTVDPKLTTPQPTVSSSEASSLPAGRQPIVRQSQPL